MNVKTYRRGRSLSRVAMAALSVITFVSIVSAQKEENIRKVQQGLVGGSVISVADQERYGLLTVSTGCSASLLRNDWVVTAAHCVDNPNPAMPGQFTTVPENSVTLTANWKSAQARQSVRIITFRPNDVAIIRIATPFTMNNSSAGYNRAVFGDGNLMSLPIMLMGRGINQFAQGSGVSATPSQGDGQFRLGLLNIDNVDGNLYGFPSTNGQSMAGGDSGGPSFAIVGGNAVLVGVHSQCDLTCVPGKTCGAWPGPGPAPAGYTNWMWVSATPRCADAPVAPIWDDIDRYLGAFVPPSNEPPLPGPIAPPGPTIVPSFIYGIGADGLLQWYRHDGARAGTGLETPGAWKGARPVGRGWDGLKQVFPGGGNIIYAITPDGTLKWYQHNGFNTGLGLESAGSWEGAKNVGHGWENFLEVFSGGEGVIYAIRQDGTLWWYRHNAYLTGGALETPGAWADRRQVGHGWNGMKQVFSGGDGVIYAIRQDGTLWWYRHNAYLTGGALETPGAWSARKQVGHGWGGFKQVFSAGDGIIYGVSEDGRLWWYRHKAYLTGGALDEPGAWTGRTVVGHGWEGFSEVFALLPGTPEIVR